MSLVGETLDCWSASAASTANAPSQTKGNREHQRGFEQDAKVVRIRGALDEVAEVHHGSPVQRLLDPELALIAPPLRQRSALADQIGAIADATRKPEVFVYGVSNVRP